MSTSELKDYLDSSSVEMTTIKTSHLYTKAFANREKKKGTAQREDGIRT